MNVDVHEAEEFEVILREDSFARRQHFSVRQEEVRTQKPPRRETRILRSFQEIVLPDNISLCVRR